MVREIKSCRVVASRVESSMLSLNDGSFLSRTVIPCVLEWFLTVGRYPLARTLIQEDPRNNSAWNQRWFSIHRGTNIKFLPLNDARAEADYAITIATLDPYNESPWVYLVGILKKQCHRMTGSVVDNDGDDTNRVGMLLKEYEGKIYAVRDILSDTHQREPDTCANLTAARIDLLELIGDKTSLEKVRFIVGSRF